jgi:hypothetical protein
VVHALNARARVLKLHKKEVCDGEVYTAAVC